jgi:sRNA-binding carbon storage regulator CsrA
MSTLALSRRLNEKVRIKTPDGTVVWVSVSEIDRQRVRLTFTAETTVTILREELVPAAERFGTGPNSRPRLPAVVERSEHPIGGIA